jgi:uncharacterized protein DUF6058
MSDVARELAERYHQVNGTHPMTAADDAYVSAQFVVLTDLCARLGRDCDEIRRLMLDRRLPLPSYLRSDGAEMVPADLFALADEAGGVDRLGPWFLAHWSDRTEGAEEFDAYLSGRYVCLRRVTPTSIRRKGELVAEIDTALALPDPPADQVHALVDELDALEPDFTAYDRLRFAGPVSRDTHIDAVRARFPRA